MHRREAIKNVAFLLGGALSATTLGVLFDSCTHSTSSNANLFSASQQKLFPEIADIIIPTTPSSPGAKAADVGPFIAMMMQECYPEEVQKIFVKGLEDLESRCQKKYSKNFLDISVKDRNDLLGEIRDETVALQKADGEQAEKDKAAGKEPQKKSYFFALVRDLTLLGYFTSKIGATQAYAYVPIPGRYDGCVDLKPGQKVWA